MSRLVVGVGNPSRGDDGIGPLVAERIARLHLPGVSVVVRAEPLALVEHLAGHDEVVVVDAARSRGGQPGAVYVVRVGSAALGTDGRAASSHGLGVAEAIELARALGRLPSRLTLVAVEAPVVDVGAPMTAQVRAAVEEALRAVLEILGVVPEVAVREAGRSCAGPPGAS